MALSAATNVTDSSDSHASSGELPLRLSGTPTSFGGMSPPPHAPGTPPTPVAVLIIRREHDLLGDAAPNAGHIFVGPAALPPAKATIAWCHHHGYSIAMEYFPNFPVAYSH